MQMKFLYVVTGDREGEKISDEVRTILSSYKKKLKRAVFNEITEKAVKSAIANPISFDEEMISAADTRSSIDKILGYRTSGIAKSKLGCDSAGRVQSALLRLICEKEEQIQKFKSSKYYEVFLDFKKGNANLTAKLSKIKDKSVTKITDKTIADDVIKNCKTGNYIVDSITEKEKKIEPKPPMTTAAMQQLASNNLGFSPARTTKAAQHLFELGYVTYIRTDSERFSDEFVAECKSHIENKYGKEFYRGLVVKAQKENSQNGHESIHQTDLKNTPEKISQFLTTDELKLYKLIYNYSLAALFVPAKVKDTDIVIKNGDYSFKISGRQIVFASYLDLFNSLDDDDVKKLPAFKKDEKINDKNCYIEEKDTQPPQRYSESGLVKLMETTGIGRPSTFSATIETLKKRNYIVIEKKAVHATEQGMRLSKMLKEYFSDVINTEYTANMEKLLDEIAGGKKTRLKVMTDFWDTFEPIVLKAAREINKDKPKPTVYEGKVCELCGKPLYLRKTKDGTREFLACSSFPRCKFTASLEIESKVNDEIIQCPECGEGHMVERKNKKGEKFYGCSRYSQGCKSTMTVEKMKEYIGKMKEYNPLINDKPNTF